MTTVSCYMPGLSGYLSTPGRTLTLKLTKSSDFSALNGAGDLLAEAGGGWFTASVDEPWTETLGAAVVNQSGLVPFYGQLGVSETRVTEVVGKVVLANDDISLLVSTTISAITSQTVFRLAAGSADNSAYVGQMVVITDAATALQKSVGVISAYAGATREVTLEAAPRFTVAIGDKVTVIAIASATSGGGGGGNGTAVTLLLGATIPLNVGSVTGLDQDLVIGDTYTADVGRRIPITLTDIYGNAVSTTFGNKSLSDVNCTIRCLLHPENARNTGNVKAFAEGTCEFVAAVGQTPAMLRLSLSHTVTIKFTPGVYRVQFRAEWSTGESVTLAWKGLATFVRRLITN
jgi:hypothetical protein